jgi:hypothetical protein
MATAIDPKSAKQNLGAHPRPKRKAIKPAPLIDPVAALMYRDETEYRRALFRDFVKFARECNSWVVSPPFDPRCRVLMPDGSPLLERLAQLPRYPVVRIGKTSRLAHGKFMDVDIVEVTLWR